MAVQDPTAQSRGVNRRCTHGKANSPEHIVWRHMKDRCYNVNSQRYSRYGARGIKVCDQWRNSFATFLEDMGPRPSPNHSIERIDNDGNYEPGNCCWATRNDQNRNKSTNVILGYNGKRLTLSEWAKSLGVCAKTLHYRLNAGWTIEQVLTRSVEPRSWNSQSPTTWKRDRSGIPLSNRSKSMLHMIADRDWFVPAEIGAANGTWHHNTLGSLVRRGCVERKQCGGGSSRRRFLYRITDAGRSEVQEVIDREARAKEIQDRKRAQEGGATT